MKEKHLIEKIKKNNAGVTLIELIVSVAIISVAIGPLLYSFVVSTKFNARSRQRQRATSAAQTVMENFKATDVDEIYKQFTDPESPTKFLRNNTSAVYTAPESGTYGTYTIDNMVLSDVGAKDSAKYSAVIEVTKGRDDASIPKIDVFDPGQDAIWLENDSELGSYRYDPNYVVTEIVNETDFDEYDLSKEDITRIDISRNMYLTIEDTGVYIYYEYPFTITLSSGVIHNKKYIHKDPTNALDLGKSCIEGGTFTSLRDIYFYYYPSYREARALDLGDGNYSTASCTVQVGKDNLYITNKASNPTNLFVYKQIDSAKQITSLSYADGNYHLYCSSKNSTNKTVLYDCIQRNLSDIKNGNYNGSAQYLFLNVSDTDSNNDFYELSPEFGPAKSALLTVNVKVTIYGAGDTEKSDPLATMTTTVVKK